MRMSEFLHYRAMRSRGIGDANSYLDACEGPEPNCSVYDTNCINDWQNIVSACETQYVSDPNSPHNLVGSSYTPTQLIPGTAAYVAAVGAAGGSVQYYQSFNPSTPGYAVPDQPLIKSTVTSTQATNQQVNTQGGSSKVGNFSFSPSGYGVGDTWSMSISGATPNSPVTISASQNGSSMGTSSFGSTDGSGNWSLSGQFGTNNVGVWSESVMVGGSVVGGLNFTVTQVTTPAQTTASNPTGGNTNTTNTGTAVVPVSGCDLSFSWDGSCIGGIVGDVTAVVGVVGILAVMYMMSRRGGR